MTYLYLLRFRARVKIGIGGNLNNRVSQIDRTTKGKQRLILAVILPFRIGKLRCGYIGDTKPTMRH